MDLTENLLVGSSGHVYVSKGLNKEKGKSLFERAIQSVVSSSFKDLRKM